MRDRILGEDRCVWCSGQVIQPRHGTRQFCEGTQCREYMRVVRLAERYLEQRPFDVAARRHTWGEEDVKGIHTQPQAYSLVAKVGTIMFDGTVVWDEKWKEEGDKLAQG